MESVIERVSSSESFEALFNESKLMHKYKTTETYRPDFSIWVVLPRLREIQKEIAPAYLNEWPDPPPFRLPASHPFKRRIQQTTVVDIGSIDDHVRLRAESRNQLVIIVRSDDRFRACCTNEFEFRRGTSRARRWGLDAGSFQKDVDRITIECWRVADERSKCCIGEGFLEGYEDGAYT